MEHSTPVSLRQLVDERPLDAVQPQDPENLKSVADAEKLAGFDVPVPTLLPNGYELKRVLWVYDTVRLQYGSKDSKQPSLYIVMGPIENNQSGPCTECPPGTNENVQIGPWQGWYWQGIFFTGTSVEGQPTPTAVWQADSPNWQLAWNTDKFWIGISFSTSENGLVMNKETLIAIAESMK